MSERKNITIRGFAGLAVLAATAVGMVTIIYWIVRLAVYVSQHLHWI